MSAKPARTWARTPTSWWPACIPWIGIETWAPDEALLLDLPVRQRFRVLSFEWFHRGFTIAAWPERGA